MEEGACDGWGCRAAATETGGAFRGVLRGDSMRAPWSWSCGPVSYETNLATNPATHKGIWRLSPAFGESAAHAAWSARRRNRSKFARPYMLRLIAFNFVICPSVCPFDHGSVQPASTAASSRRTL